MTRMTAILLLLICVNAWSAEERDLSVLLKLPKEELTTDEAIKVYKALGDKKILTSVKSSEVQKFEGKREFRIYNEQWEKGVGSGRTWKTRDVYYNNIYNFVDSFNVGERLYIGRLPNGYEYVLEPMVKTSNFLYSENSGIFHYPYSFDVDDEGNAWIPLGNLVKFTKNTNFQIFNKGWFSTYGYFNFDKNKSEILFGDGNVTYIYNLVNTNYKEYSIEDEKTKDIVLKFKNKYLSDFQEDAEHNVYKNDEYRLITINDIPAIANIAPYITGFKIRSFIVKPEGDIYFRWVVIKGDYDKPNFKKLYALFRLRKIRE